MHFDGIGPFENEEGAALLEDIRSGALDPALMIPGKYHGRLDEELGALVVALVNLAGLPDAELPEGIAPAAVAGLREPENRHRLRDAQDAVFADATVSELYAHWAREGRVHEWKAVSYRSLG